MEGKPSDENLVFIGDSSETSVLYAIQQRFDRKRIYVGYFKSWKNEIQTHVGDNLVVLNPYEKYPIYDNFVISQYKDDNPIAFVSTESINLHLGIYLLLLEMLWSH